MKKYISHIIFLCVLTATGMATAFAYAPTTHEELSDNAVTASVINTDGTLLPSLGLRPLTEKQEFPSSQGAPQNVRTLFRTGANFEDGFDDCESRPRNHFYNPLNGSGLQWLVNGEPSPDWALEDTRAVDGQDHSFKDAREYFYKALTRPTETERDKFFGLTFQTMGHVIHHIQDMAQPQHVRNDVHISVSENCWYKSIAKVVENPSRYEFYTDGPIVRPALPFGGYGATEFKTAREFWHTQDRRGMADFTNRGFFSAGTILFDPALPEPFINGVEQVEVRQLFSNANPSVSIPDVCQNDASPCYMTFLKTNVVDGYNPSLSGQNSRAATVSIFDQDLIVHNRAVTYTSSDGRTWIAPQIYTLNRFNFDEAHKFLIPRAVGYSTGMINYFFRGKMDLDIDYASTTVAQYLIKNSGQEDLKGSFTLYYDAVDGKRYPVPGDAPDITWKDITVPKNEPTVPDSGQSPSLTPPILPSNPKPKRPDEYILVFKGQQGEEKPLDAQSVGAVAAKSKLKPLWEPWREQLTDNHAWTSGAGTVNGKVGLNSQTLQNGHLVESVGAGGAGFVAWQAVTADDLVSGRYMKIRLNCGQSAFTENWNVYGYISVGPNLPGSQTIPFAGGAGLGTSLYDLPRSTTQQEYIIDLGRLGFSQIGYVDISTIGFDMELTCSVDYVDFSDKPFEKMADGKIFIP